MVQINWTKKAQQDLKDIGDYISIDSLFYAARVINNILERIKILKQFPRAGKMVAEYGEECVRELVFGNYRIIYEIISETRIDLLTIHHSAKNLSGRNIYKTE